MATTVDDQEILKLKKSSGKKRRSRHCFISPSSLIQKPEDLTINQFPDGENTMVYALVEVSKDSEKPAKREKIPLNNRDFFQVMQKFMVSKKEKPDRKILKPSKRKRVLESTSVSTHISKEEKNMQNDALAWLSLGYPDDANVIYKQSSHSVNDKLKNKERDRLRRRMRSGDKGESEQSHLKILYNRNNTVNNEPNIKREKLCPVSRGTNTVVVQTPKVLEEAFGAMASNLDSKKVCDKKDGNEGKKGHENDACKLTQSDAPNFVLVPFIITKDQVSAWTKISHESVKNEEYKFKNKNDTEILPCKTVSDDGTTQKCLTDKHSDFCFIKCDRLSNATFAGIRSDKNGITHEEKQEDQNILNDVTIDKGICLLREVKTLQMKLNAIVEGLETKTFTCLRALGAQKKDNTLLNETCTMEDHPNCEEQSGDPELPLSPTIYKDCGVQAMIVTSYCDKMVTVPSGTVIYKSLTDRFVQFPSQVKMKTPAKPSSFKRLLPCKSSPLFKTNFECQYIRMKRAVSMIICKKQIEEAKCMHWTNLNHNYEGSLPEDDDQFNEDLEFKVFRRKSKEEPHRSEKSINILFRKNNPILAAESEKNKLVTVKQCGKIAKIKIVGNTSLNNENPNSGLGKIKLELNELGSIKISNKFSRKQKVITNNDSICNNSNNNTSTNSYSKIAVSNVSCNIKEVENNKRVIGKTETVSKIARKETTKKKISEVVKSPESNPKTSSKDLRPGSPQLAPRASKLKKPSTPVRLYSRVKEDNSNSSPSPRTPPSTALAQAEDVELMKSPRPERSTEKVSDKRTSSCGSCTPQKRSPVLSPECDSNPVMTTNEPETPVKAGNLEEHPAKMILEESNADKQSPPLKSIWALTKVILYEDGTQSFEVLEASSHPLKYQLNKKNAGKTPNESTTDTKTTSDSTNPNPKDESNLMS